MKTEYLVLGFIYGTIILFSLFVSGLVTVSVVKSKYSTYQKNKRRRNIRLVRNDIDSKKG